MIYRFEKVYECGRSATVEANSFEEAKEMIDNCEAEWIDDNEEYLITSRCIEMEDEDDDGEELKWTPERWQI